MAILPKLSGLGLSGEDPALIQGLGQYVDDILWPAHCTRLLAQPVCARITGLHVEAARQHPGWSPS